MLGLGIIVVLIYMEMFFTVKARMVESTNLFYIWSMEILLENSYSSKEADSHKTAMVNSLGLTLQIG